MSAAEPATYLYRELGGKFRVKVLSDVTTDGMREAKLVCVEMLRPTRHGGTMEVGEVFDVTCKRGDEWVVGWTLEKEADERN